MQNGNEEKVNTQLSFKDALFLLEKMRFPPPLNEKFLNALKHYHEKKEMN